MAELLVPPRGSFAVELFIRCLQYAFQQAGRPNFRVSSWQRSVAQQDDLVEQSRGVPNSLHLKGLAMDLIPGDVRGLERLGLAWRELGLDAVFGGGATSTCTGPGCGPTIVVGPFEVPPFQSTIRYLHIELDGPGLRARGLSFKD